ncbi:MAG: carboxypeptidase regulatory-like domain-containing protein [Nitrospiraceae bacterium]|nr:MAG: carboxypeptidase regulatory-like domain-containing protein [Nitrospiraceae bacterium]
MKKILSSATAFIVSIVVCGSVFAQQKLSPVMTGTISGKIAEKGKGPLKGGMVLFFSEKSGPPPSATRYWRVPSHAFSIDDKGSFKAVLPEGHYYMGATQKSSGEQLGPPEDGDLFFISQDKNGEPKLHTVKGNKNLDMGVIAEAKPFSSKTLVTEGITSIQGTITDEKGKPVAGMLVFAFPTPTMFGRPLFVSERTDKNGNYLLRLSGGGKYYLSSRANYGGGPPTAEQNIGSYAKGQPVSIQTGETVKGINITVSTPGFSGK